jgi:hypothetical protein
MLRAMIVTAAVLLVGGVTAPKAQAQYPDYYKSNTGQCWYSKGSGAYKYYYCYYYYAPGKYHHCYYYPSVSKRYVYYYNWQTKVYWGRYDLESGEYAMLEDGDKKGELKDIPPDAFKKNVKPIGEFAIPGSDGAKMRAPPKLPE